MQKEALTTIAKQALEEYEGSFSSITFFIKATSTIFKVEDQDRQVYALKFYDDGSSNKDDNLIELLILDKIKEKGSIYIAETIKNKNGAGFTIFTDKLTNKTYRIVLSKWLEGDDLKGKENEVLFIELGKLVAKLHLATQDLEIPKNIQPKKWNQIFYFRDEQPIYHEKRFQDKISTKYKDLMDEAVPILNEELEKIYHSGKPQLLHGDINPWNIKVNSDKLGMLDFEDAILGQPIQEIAILLFYYKNHEDFAFSDVKKWILEGYRSINQLGKVEAQTLDILMMARNVNFLNYVLTLEEDHSSFIKKGLEELKLFLNNWHQKSP